MKKVKVAIIQVSPEYLNLEKSVAKAVELIRSAAADGAQLITMGETWLSGYPAWLDLCPDVALWDHHPTQEVFAQMRESSVTVPGKETQIFSDLTKELGITLVIGVNEKIEQGPGNGTLYNALLFFNEKGELANHHRKLVPTYTERMVWGQGDAHGLKTTKTAFGYVGGLICWEHWMPLTRQALHTAGEHIHIAVWPTAHEMLQIASRHYAFEGRCFVLAAGSILKASDLPEQLQKPQDLTDDPDKLVLRGGSSIIGPDGKYIAEPVYGMETIVTAELDLSEIDRQKLTLDTTGHYFRPDLFRLKVKKKRLI